MNNKEWKNFLYRMHYELQNYDYLIEENNLDNFLKYLKSHGIKNDGGYLFGDCFRFVVLTNTVHNKIIKENFAFA